MMNEKILIICGIIVALVNIITEVAKNVVPSLKTSKSINLFVLIVSVIMTMGTYVFYSHYSGAVIDGYGIVSSLIGGILIAYSAMFGFDKLLVYFEPFVKKG